MKQEMVTIPKQEYEALKVKADIDLDILKEFAASFLDIKQGKVRRVK